MNFLKIGSTAFGGFMALISVVQNEIVERKKLMTHGEMVDGISLATILPGPVAVNVVAYVGYKLRGGLGALVSATGVILPSFLLIVALSAAYFRWGQIPAVNKLFLGFIPAVTAIIVHAAWGMARKTILGLPELIIAVIACLLLLYKGGFFITLIIIVGAGLVGWLSFARFSNLSAGTAENKPAEKRNGAKLLAFNAPLAAAPFLALDAGLGVKLFLTFAGMSVLLFGGGFVFIPLIEHIVVQEQAWLTRQEFIDAIALGQITPGPILISAAFIGYKVMGLSGAAIATVAIFLPPALLMLVSAHFLIRARESVVVQAVLRGIRPAVVGMIAAAAWSIGTTAVPNWLSAVIFLAALIALLRFRVDVAWIIPLAGLSGLLLY
ncbi:MAG: chromate efflux transporter [Burkholderiales bacterium]